LQLNLETMLTENKNEIIYSKNIIELLTVANEYCLFTEKAEQYQKEDIIYYYLKICPLLYLKGILLPSVEECDFEITERYVTEEIWEHIFISLNKKIGQEDNFLSFNNNEDVSEKNIIKQSISEQIADIYQDLKDFIILYQKNTQAAKINAVAECYRLFATHWGNKIIKLQMALHNIIFPGVPNETEI